MVNNKTKRYYWLSITQDLLGDWCLHKVSGGLNKNQVREQTLHFENKLQASQAMFDCEVINRKRGYIYEKTSTAEDYALTPQLIAEVEYTCIESRI